MSKQIEEAELAEIQSEDSVGHPVPDGEYLLSVALPSATEITAENLRQTLTDANRMNVNLAVQYLKFDKIGQSKKAIFRGFSRMTSQDGKEIEVAVFMSPNDTTGTAEMWMNGGAQLVSVIRRLGFPVGTALDIVLENVESKSLNGETRRTNIFGVYLLLPNNK